MILILMIFMKIICFIVFLPWSCKVSYFESFENAKIIKAMDRLT